MSFAANITATNCQPAANLTRRNHFVPCFYSSLWTGPDGKLCEFSRPHNEVKAKRKFPAATGYRDDLYTEPSLPLDVCTYLEDIFLKMVDQRACDALGFILAGRLDDLSPDLMTAWVRFIMSMLQRSPLRIAELREKWREAYLDIDNDMEEKYQQIREPADAPTLKAFLGNAPQETYARGQVRVFQKVMDLPRVGKKILNMRWGVLTIPDSKFKFLTSDRPVIKTNGLVTEESHVAIPIGPRKLFIAANKHETMITAKRKLPRDLVVSVNDVVAKQAEQFVYGDSDIALRFVEKRLARHSCRPAS